MGEQLNDDEHRGSWRQVHAESWVGLILVLALYLNGLWSGWVHWPWT